MVVQANPRVAFSTALGADIARWLGCCVLFELKPRLCSVRMPQFAKEKRLRKKKKIAEQWEVIPKANDLFCLRNSH